MDRGLRSLVAALALAAALHVATRARADDIWALRLESGYVAGAGALYRYDAGAGASFDTDLGNFALRFGGVVGIGGHPGRPAADPLLLVSPEVAWHPGDSGDARLYLTGRAAFGPLEGADAFQGFALGAETEYRFVSAALRLRLGLFASPMRDERGRFEWLAAALRLAVDLGEPAHGVARPVRACPDGEPELFGQPCGA